jgi:hypothetical protein
MSAETIVNRAIQNVRALVKGRGNQRLDFALALVEEYLISALYAALHEVAISAPGVVIEDYREHGGAIVSDLRGVQDKANG